MEGLLRSVLVGLDDPLPGESVDCDLDGVCALEYHNLRPRNREAAACTEGRKFSAPLDSVFCASRKLVSSA